MGLRAGYMQCDWYPQCSPSTEARQSPGTGRSCSMTLTPWLNALLLAAVFALAQQLDGPDDIQAAQDVAADVQAAVQTAKAQPNTN